MQNFNTQLEENENELIDFLKNCSNLAYEILSDYKNIFDKYNSESQELYSFLNCNFIKNDLYYLLSEVENTLINEFSKIYNYHLLLFLTVIILLIELIIYYSLAAYDLYKLKENKEDNLIERIKKEIN